MTVRVVGGSPDVDEPYAYILPSTTPAGTYYVTVGDLTDESPGCGDFTVEADGDFNLEEQTVRFTSPRPTNAQTGGSYIVTAEASSGLPVFIDTNSLSTSLCEISGHTSGSVVTYTHPGTCMIRANQPGDDTYDSAFQASQTFDVAVGSPAKLEFDQAPSSTGVAGVALAAAVVVNEVDAYRNLETSDSVSTISLTANGPGQMRNEPITATLANGSARFDNDLIFDTAGNYSITAVSNASGAPSATSSRISISPNTGALLKFLPGLPSAVDQGAQIGPITVIETDDFGNRAAADNSTSVIFRVDVCGDTDLGLGVLTAGEVVFAHLPILHKVRDVSLIAQPAISPGPTPANARTSVIPNANYIFASGSELCEP